MTVRWILLGVSMTFSPLPATAEVVQSSDAGFTVSQKLIVTAPAARVWATLTQPSLWWDGAHTYSGDSNNLTLDLRPGGCWCEKTPTGGVEHMRVVNIAAPAVLRMTGALGPLQAMPVTAVMTVTLKAAGTGTEMTLTYAVAGTGLVPLAPAVDGVLGQQVARLKKAVEAPAAR